jgi:histidine ammonia-lyase
MYVRSIDQLAKDSIKAKGRRLTAREALDAYGFEKLLEVASEGSALLAESIDAAGRVLKARRLALGACCGMTS